jgi:hypothetical protein
VELVNAALDIIARAGPVGCLVLFAWLWMTGRIVSRGEMDRAEAAHEREKQQIKDERDHARKEGAEWKFMAMRGTDLAKFLGEKTAAQS